MQQNVQHADLFYCIGEAKRNVSDFHLAEHFLLKAISMKLHPSSSYYSLGLVYQSLDQFEKAVDLLGHFTSLEDSAKGHYELARCFMKLKRFSESVVHFTRSLELEDSATVYLLRAEAYEMLGMLEQARQDYRKILEVDPNFHKPYLSYAKQLEEQGQTEQAQSIRKFLSKLCLI